MTPSPDSVSDSHAGLPFQPFSASTVGFFHLLISLLHRHSLFTLMDYCGDGQAPFYR